MDEIIQALSSPVWWFSVVIAGILINIISSYMKNSIDNSLSKVSGWWKVRNENVKKIHENNIEFISQSEHNIQMEVLRVISCRITAVLYIVLGIFVLTYRAMTYDTPPYESILETVLALATVSILITLAFKKWFESNDIAKDVTSARIKYYERLLKQSQPETPSVPPKN